MVIRCSGQVPVIVVLMFYVNLLVTASRAQSIPNSGFETWHDVPNSFGAQDPDGWTSSNTAIPFIGNPIEKTTKSYQGKYAAGLKTYNVFGSHPPMELVNGVCPVASDYSLDIIQAGTPITIVQVEVTGYYLYDPPLEANDTAVVVGILKKWNAQFNRPDTVAIGSLQLSESTFFTRFDLALQTVMQGIVPDSIIVAFKLMSGNPNPAQPPALIIDEISLRTSGGIEEIIGSNHFALYPNPSSASIIIPFTPEGAQKASIKIFDARGRDVTNKFHISFSLKGIFIERGNVSSGLYIYRLLTRESFSQPSSVIQSGKFIIQ